MTHNILFATTNPHKLDEVRAILEPRGLRVLSLNDVPAAADTPEPVEDADTFEGNAKIKAVHYARLAGQPTLADDSGLEVDALDAQPGVRSARYAQLDDPHAPRAQRDAANNAKLAQSMESVPDHKRTARFVCAMCLALPSGKVVAASRGTFEGSIARQPRGKNGFGYDPFLIVADDPQGRTSAELSPQEKNQRSHRAAAARAIAPDIAAALNTAAP